MSAPDIIAIVWAPHEARTAAYAKWLNAPLFNIHYLQYKRPLVAPFKYVLQWGKTWLVLYKQRPRFVYITNSPPVAGFCVFVFSRLFGTKFIMDTHSPVLFNLKWGWTRPLTRFVSRFAAMNIVDQERFKALFESWGAKAVILERPPAVIPVDALVATPTDDIELVYIGTFGYDEPIDILLDAARRLPHIRLYILGDKNHAKSRWLETAPPNVIFTGYLLKADYWNRLYNARAIIGLTIHEHSLLGVAQDGLYMDKPLILSDQPALREYFTKGAVFANNTADGMVTAIETLLASEERLRGEIQELHHEKEQRWKTAFQQILDMVRTP